MKKPTQFGLLFAWIVSITATLGSLYLSEILHWTPCKLCWIQRIFMYPLSVLLGIAYFRKDKNIVFYALPFSILGGMVSIYHYLYQKTDWFDKVQSCTVGVSCKSDYVGYLGFITIPFMCLTAFVLISFSLFYFYKKNK